MIDFQLPAIAENLSYRPCYSPSPWGEGELKTDLFRSTLNHPNPPLLTPNHPFLRKNIFFLPINHQLSAINRLQKSNPLQATPTL